jgi:hypothetical protein
MTLHFVNYQKDSKVDGISVRLRVPAASQIGSIEWRSPDGRRVELDWEELQGFASFELPAMEIYGLVSIRLKQ